MASLQDLLAKKAALEQEIEATQKRERSDAINQVKSLMAQYGLSVADLAAKPPGTGKGGVAVAPIFKLAPNPPATS